MSNYNSLTRYAYSERLGKVSSQGTQQWNAKQKWYHFGKWYHFVRLFCGVWWLVSDSVTIKEKVVRNPRSELRNKLRKVNQLLILFPYCVPFRVFLVKLTDWRANEALEERRLSDWLILWLMVPMDNTTWNSAKNGKPSGQSTYLRIASPNPDKSNIFSCGVNEAIPVGILCFNEGSLPIRYLGVPFISSRLKKSDCKSLVDRIVTRAISWASQVFFLSYAGRLQLVNSILFAIQTYWSSMFILPKAKELLNKTGRSGSQSFSLERERLQSWGKPRLRGIRCASLSLSRKVGLEF